MRKASAEKELLSAEDVAEYLGVGEVTVYRWCREGTLPCLKIGRRWRVRREVLEDFLKRSEHPTTLVGQLGSFLRVPDNVLAIAQNADILRRLDAAFFRVGEARGGLLVKFYAGEEYSEDELLASFGADHAWRYVTYLTVGYLISRGLAKAGSREPYRD